MPTRDRLAELQQSAVLMENGAMEGDQKSDEELQKVFQKAEVVKKWVGAIEENTNMCEGILKKSVTNSSKEHQSRLESTFKNSETLSFNITTSLKQMQADLGKQTDKTSTNYRMRIWHLTSLKQQFRRALEEHRDCMQKHRDIRKELLGKSAKIANNEQLDDQQLEVLIDRNDQQLFTKNYLIDEREAKQQLLDLETRHQELLTIEAHLTEVRDLFIQMAVLIDQQQESIDRVEFHALSATDYIDNTVVDLQAAQRSKKKGIKMKIYIALAVIIVALILIIALVK